MAFDIEVERDTEYMRRHPIVARPQVVFERIRADCVRLAGSKSPLAAAVEIADAKAEAEAKAKAEAEAARLEAEAKEKQEAEAKANAPLEIHTRQSQSELAGPTGVGALHKELHTAL